MRMFGYRDGESGDSALPRIGSGAGQESRQEPQIKTSRRCASLEKPKRDLNASSATIILLCYFVAQILAVTLVAAAALAIARSRGIYDVNSFFTELSKLMPAAFVLCPIMSGLGTVLASVFLIPKFLKDGSPTGAAWVRGSWTAIARGFAMGVVVSACTYGLSKMLNTHVHDRDLVPLTRMALTPGLPRMLCTSTVLFFAPAVEEILFRGALYGGYRKSFGPIWAAVLTTALFLVVHLPGMVHPMPAVMGIIGAALTALWNRLRAGAIGPAIAVHVGFNSWSMFLVVLQ